MIIRKGSMYKTLFIAFFLTSLFITAFAQDNYFGNKIKSDNSGNIYAAGIFNGNSINFGSYELFNEGVSDIFLVKYDSNGKVIWAKNLGGKSNEELISLEVDNYGNASLLISSKSKIINLDNSQLINNFSELIFKAEFNSSGNLNFAQVVEEIQNNFSLKKPGNDTLLTIISPVENDNLKVGTKGKIVWHSENVDDVLLELSTDNGANWESFTVYSTAFSEFLFVVPNTPSDFCLIRISDFNNPSIADTSGIFKIYGELYWKLIQSNYNSVLTSVFSIDSSTCIAAGYNGLTKTTDNGETWINQLIGTGLFDIFFLNENIGWAVGFNGIIFKSTNGGADWIQQESSFNSHLLKIFFSDDNNGYMISDNHFLKTTNGGESWSVSQPTGHTLRAMFFIDNNTGWIAGGEGVILKTTNGGLSWNYQQLNGTEYSILNSLYFTNENTGWSSGCGLDVNGGIVLRTNNSGSQWALMNSGYGISFYSITFIDADTGWIAGDEGNMFSTTNGGLTWELEGSGTLADLHSIVMNNQTGWSVGNDGVILKYINNYLPLPVPVELAGFKANIQYNIVELSWLTVTETNNRGFEIQRMKERQGWEVVGFIEGNGTTTAINNYSFIDENISAGKYFYRLKQIDFDGTLEFSNVIEIEVGLPDQFSLLQNYPNPFNPATKIKFVISESSFVTIKVYDITGREVITLINEEKHPGFYEVEFSLPEGKTGLSTGIYFYTMKAGNFIQTKKMMLLK